MPLSLPTFGPQIPAGNSKQVLSSLQSVGLPNPKDEAVRNALVDAKLAGDVKTNMDAKDASQLLAGRAAPQAGPPVSDDELKMQRDITIQQQLADPVKYVTTMDQLQNLIDISSAGVQDTPSDTSTSNSKLILQKETQIVKPPSYYKVRIPWELTTVRRLALGLPPILFYVNPESVRYNLQLTQSLDQVQRGFFLTIWKDYDYDGNPNFFPCMKFNFKFQSSNILPESYGARKSLVNTARTKTEFSQIQQQADQLADETAKKIKEGTYISEGALDEQYGGQIPPGLRNFYDVMDLFNEDRIINIADAAMWDDTRVQDAVEALQPYNGEPNYVLLKISTRVFPKMWLMGFFENGLQWDESAMDPLGFTSDLAFIAFKSDPMWWDTEKIQATYSSFWEDYFKGSLQNLPVTEDKTETRADAIENLDEIPYIERDLEDITPGSVGPIAPSNSDNPTSILLRDSNVDITPGTVSSATPSSTSIPQLIVPDATPTVAPSPLTMSTSTPVSTPPSDKELTDKYEFLGPGFKKCSLNNSDLTMAKKQVASGVDPNTVMVPVAIAGQAPATISYSVLKGRYGF